MLKININNKKYFFKYTLQVWIIGFTSLFIYGSREFPYFSVNKFLRSRNSGRSEILAAAYINDGIASLHSSGHSLYKKLVYVI